MENFLIFVGMAVVTYFTRVAMIAIMGREVPPLLQRWLRYIPAAVLAALVAPAALAPNGHIEINFSIGAILVGAIVAWCTRNVFLTILAGMATYWILRLSGLF
jgi:branched-subunit amino acid transport protein